MYIKFVKFGVFVSLLVAVLVCVDAARSQIADQVDPTKPQRDAVNGTRIVAQAGTAPAKTPIEVPKKPVAAPKEAGVKPVQAAPVETAEEKGVRASAAEFVKLYNAHDAKGLTALFVPTAEMIDVGGNITKGRDAIEQQFVKSFEATPKTTMKIDIGSVRIVTPGLAIEEGVARSKDSPEDSEDASAYVAIHVKSDGKWLLASVRDSAPQELTAHEHLESLGWLVGDWVEESAESVVRTSCKWSDNGNFLLQDFSVQIGGQIAMSGTMRIGWDAVRKQFKSWVFDSHGGYAEGYWLFDGDEWIVKSMGATAAGEAASATIVYRPMDAETVMWSSTDRLIDGELRENIDPIIVKRRPPEPTK